MFFAKLHPLLVHFPVGLLVSGTLFELYGNFRGEKIVAKAGAFNVRFGFWCSLPVALVGFLGVMSIELKNEFKPFVANHMFFTFSTVLFEIFQVHRLLPAEEIRCPRLQGSVPLHRQSAPQYPVSPRSRRL